MKFAYPMLLDFVETSLTAVEVGDLLTMAGFELEGIEEIEGDPVLDVKVVSNRGDGLSVFGLAREVLAKDPSARPTALYQSAQNRFEGLERLGEGKPLSEAQKQASVEIETSDCTRYACRLFEGVQNGPSPDWIQKRLRQAGQRPISLLVDLTNYVMLELGQPLHAFDFDTLRGGRIVVRYAREGESLVTLNGQRQELSETRMMMICDAERPVAVAGVMGGQDTEVGPSTQRVLLESAHFKNTSVRRTRKLLALSTEASYRFERSVDPEGVVAALNRFAQLMSLIDGGASVLPGVLDAYPGKIQRRPIKLRVTRAVKLLGMPVTAQEAKGYLQRLGMEVHGLDEPFMVAPPSWRPDIVREDDLIEEIGRVHGYEKIPEELPHGASLQGGAQGVEAWTDRLREEIVRQGFVQTISHSLRGRHVLDDPRLEAVGPRNPVPEMEYLRTSLLPSLADAARRNGGRDVHLFEVGNTFGRSGEELRERKLVALLSEGALEPPSWANKTTTMSGFFTLKGSLEAALAAVGTRLSFETPADPDPRLHPSRQAAVIAEGHELGVLGQIHPDAAHECALPPHTVVAELDVLLAYEHSRDGTRYRPVSRNPSVRRDMAVVIAREVQYRRIERAIEAACGEVLERQWLFDVYEGPGIPGGHHSLAIALQLRKMGENFTDEEANQVRDRAVQALASLGGKLR
ncbi:MAG TPA: phenylalanine--tRNA ligase subunit beta [Fimbriimonadaceae bacterium]|nr:phenylalanine--tRNA ligase subunit beta [Fimbriimonadaceae bacterium]